MIEPTGFCFECGEPLSQRRLFYCCDRHRKNYLKKNPAPGKNGPKPQRIITIAMVQRDERAERRKELRESGFKFVKPFSRASRYAPRCSIKECKRGLTWPGEIESGLCLKHLQARNRRQRKEQELRFTSNKSLDYQRAKAEQG